MVKTQKHMQTYRETDVDTYHLQQHIRMRYHFITISIIQAERSYVPDRQINRRTDRQTQTVPRRQETKMKVIWQKVESLGQVHQIPQLYLPGSCIGLPVSLQCANACFVKCVTPESPYPRSQADPSNQ